MLGLPGGGDADRVPVAAHSLRDPEDVDLFDARGGRCFSGHGSPPFRSTFGADRLFELQRLDLQLLAPGDVDVQPTAGRAAQREVGQRDVCAAVAAAPAAGTCSITSSAPSSAVPWAISSNANVERGGPPGAGARRCTSTLPPAGRRRADARSRTSTAAIASSCSRPSADPWKWVAHELVHHPPAAERGLDEHHAGRLRLDLADLGARSQPGTDRSAVEGRVGRLRRRRRRPACPRSRRTSGRCRAARPPPRRRGRPALRASRTIIATPDARASSFRPRRLRRGSRRACSAATGPRRRAGRRRPATASTCRTRSRRRARTRRGPA